MSTELRVGAIVFSSDCSCVALVKRSALNLWGFPRGGQNGHKLQQAAKQAVRTETGIVLTDFLSTVTFEAEEQIGITARLYIATGIEVEELAPEKDCVTDAVQAAWFPLRQVFDSDPEGAGALVAPFLTALHRWLDSNLAVFGEALGSAEAFSGEDLAECMIYRRRSWKGVLPVSHLAQWALDRQLPSPCYDSVHNPRVLHMQCVTCILPHLGLQITPDWGSVTTEDATQNAALAAIMFLAGGLGKDSAHCIITLVGSDPTVRPLLLNCKQALDMVDRRARHVLREQELARKAFETQQEGWDKESSTLQQQKAALAKGGSQAAAVVKQIATWQASLPQAEQSSVQAPRGVLNFPVMKTRGVHAINGIVDKGSNKKRQKEDGPQADLQRTQIKNPVQELKEVLDKHKWAQAEYSFQGQQDDGGHICHIAVRDAGITGIVSQPCQNQRSAKSSAASQALSILLQKNLT
ncbi:hypothetical protein WJX77_009722 [Trebouxia sp. C0004]